MPKERFKEYNLPAGSVFLTDLRPMLELSLTKDDTNVLLRFLKDKFTSHVDFEPLSGGAIVANGKKYSFQPGLHGRSYIGSRTIEILLTSENVAQVGMRQGFEPSPCFSNIRLAVLKTVLLEMGFEAQSAETAEKEPAI